MTDYVINADSFGSYYQYVGGNSTDDTVTINIGPNFSGSVTVDSLGTDGELETVVVNLPDGWTAVLTDSTASGNEGPDYTDKSYLIYNDQGQEIGTMSIRSNYVSGVPCFTVGTKIDTPDGPRAIETLMPGDLVLTRDNGAQPVRWRGERQLTHSDLIAAPELCPIRIAANALGPGIPAIDLTVSPQHRILLRSRIVERMFDVPEVLVAAKQLGDVHGVETLSPPDGVTYVHLLFDRHEVITANGAETESLFTGPEALKAIPPHARQELFMLFPELITGTSDLTPARSIPPGRRARKLIERSIRNIKPLTTALG